MIALAAFVLCSAIEFFPLAWVYSRSNCERWYYRLYWAAGGLWNYLNSYLKEHYSFEEVLYQYSYFCFFPLSMEFAGLDRCSCLYFLGALSKLLFCQVELLSCFRCSCDCLWCEFLSGWLAEALFFWLLSWILAFLSCLSHWFSSQSWVRPSAFNDWWYAQILWWG